MRKRQSDEGFAKALEIMRRAATPYGFVASNVERDNYRRIWARDGVIVSVAALQTDEDELHQAAYHTLQTLRNHQGPHGEIPSNVEPEKNQVSYGGTAGRVDGNLWFIIGCWRYWKHTQAEDFLRDFLPCLKRIEFLLGAWEYNTKGLLYVPETGDWADEYIQHGYVLYDQLLYYQALRGLSEMYQAAEEADFEKPHVRAEKLRKLIQANYWFYDCEPDHGGAYHPTIFKRGCEMAEEKGSYWMSYFSPTGYGYRFDAMANVLASLLEIANKEQQAQVDAYIESKIINPNLKVLPAFSPTIEPVDADWKDLQSTFSNTFKNNPYEYHNGGLWPLISGFYVADLVTQGKTERAQEYLEAIHAANARGAEGEDWGFYEFINGQTLQPGGTRHQTWSAAAAVMGTCALNGRLPFGDEHLPAASS